MYLHVLKTVILYKEDLCLFMQNVLSIYELDNLENLPDTIYGEYSIFICCFD